jgi:hypothetical protein
MSKMHVNPVTGAVGYCRASSDSGKGCPFGGESGRENHFDSREEAQVYVEEIMANQYNQESVILTKSSERERKENSRVQTPEELKVEEDLKNQMVSFLENMKSSHGARHKLSVISYTFDREKKLDNFTNAKNYNHVLSFIQNDLNYNKNISDEDLESQYQLHKTVTKLNKFNGAVLYNFDQIDNDEKTRDLTFEEMAKEKADSIETVIFHSSDEQRKPSIKVFIREKFAKDKAWGSDEREQYMKALVDNQSHRGYEMTKTSLSYIKAYDTAFAKKEIRDYIAKRAEDENLYNQ